MRKVSILILTIGLFISSCSKEERPKPADALHEITFNVGGFRQQIGSKTIGLLSADSEPLGDFITTLHYLIYGSDGKLVRNLKQASTESNFGTITDRVPEGEYTVVFIGCLKEVALSATGGLSKDHFKNLVTDNDIFFSKANVTVGSSALERNIVLDRIVSHLQLVIEDELPANVTKVDFTVDNEYPTFSFASGTIRAEVVENRLISSNISTAEDRTNFRAGLYLLNDQHSLNLQISCYSATGQLLKYKRISNVICQRNKRTIVSGKLFEDPAAGFKISLNSEWEPEPILNPF